MQNHQQQEPHTSDSTQNFLSALRNAYGKRGNERDVFGRRNALPSEVAHVLGCSSRATPESEEQE